MDAVLVILACMCGLAIGGSWGMIWSYHKYEIRFKAALDAEKLANDTITGTLDERERLNRANIRLTESNKELMDEAKNNHSMDASQLAEFTRITQEHAKLNDQQNAITVFLRDNFPGVKAGKYAGMQFSEMVVAIIRENQYRGPQ